MFAIQSPRTYWHLLSYHNLILGLNVTVGGKPLGYFTSVAEDLNSRLLRTNTASGQGGS